MRTKRRSLTAKSLLLHGPRTLNWHQEMLPLVDSNHVVIETVAGAISIGTEIPKFLGTARQAVPTEYPTMIGYESYGRITSVGKRIPEQYIGEMVIAHYGHRTHAILPLDEVIFVPSRVPPPTALLTTLTCDVAKGIRKLQITPEERVLITGAGAIGLMAIWLLKRYGVQTIHVLEPETERRDKALELGATVAVHPDEAASWIDDFDVGLECSSNNEGFQRLQQKMIKNGRICILSDGNRESLTLSSHFHYKELTILGSSDGWDYQKHAVWFWQMVEDDHSLADALFDLTVPIPELLKTFHKLGNGAITPIKVLINYQVESW